jgi:hypothetical protein
VISASTARPKPPSTRAGSQATSRVFTQPGSGAIGSSQQEVRPCLLCPASGSISEHYEKCEHRSTRTPHGRGTGRASIPISGLNRPAIDFGWAFTYIEPTSKLQFNGTFGLTTSFKNEATDYDTGDEFHFESAVGKDFGHGVVLGVVGYDYRQLSDDAGAGVPAILNGFKGEVDAIGPGLTYTTEIGKIPFILNARHYEEFNATHRFDNSVTLITGTFVF